MLTWKERQIEDKDNIRTDINEHVTEHEMLSAEQLAMQGPDVLQSLINSNKTSDDNVTIFNTLVAIKLGLSAVPILKQFLYGNSIEKEFAICTLPLIIDASSNDITENLISMPVRSEKLITAKIYALSYLDNGNKSILDIIEDGLKSKKRCIREAAINAVPRLYDYHAVTLIPELINVYLFDSDPKMQQRAELSLYRIPDLSVPYLINSLSNSNKIEKLLIEIGLDAVPYLNFIVNNPNNNHQLSTACYNIRSEICKNITSVFSP